MMDTGKDLNKHEITRTLNLEKLAADFLKKKRQEKIINILSITFTSSKYHYYITFLFCLITKNDH